MSTRTVQDIVGIPGVAGLQLGGRRGTRMYVRNLQPEHHHDDSEQGAERMSFGVILG